MSRRLLAWCQGKRSGVGAEPKAADQDHPERFRIGTLQYTKAGLISLFCWLLWGDFCFTLMEAIVPAVLPLQLRSLGASNFAIGILVSTIPSVFNFLVVPIVGSWSDRHRSKHGRRIPFLLWPTPFLVLFLAALGFTREIGAFFADPALASRLPLAPATMAVLAIGVLVAGFQFFNMFVSSVYYYLFADVVPQAFLGRFMALFRVVGTLAGFVFSAFIYSHAEEHARWIYLGAAGAYFVGFLVMCLRVKEGEYPPPPAKSPGIRSAIGSYFRECFSHGFYVWFFVGTSLWMVSVACNVFAVFLLRDSLGISLETIGWVAGLASLLGAAVLYPLGVLVDRFHPLRMLMLALAFLVPVSLLTFFFLRGPTSYLALTLVSVPLGALLQAAYLPVFVALLPKDRYGQFCSAQALVRSALVIALGPVAGLFMDFVTDRGAVADNYRYLYLWAMGFQALTLLCLVPVYREWKRRGGIAGYTPPEVRK